jgi:hypothetical protein
MTIDIYAHWGDKPPVYRVYVDGDLLTERTFIFEGNKNYIKEHMILELDPGEHYVEVVKFGTIIEKNILIEGSTLNGTVVDSRHKFTITE